MEIHGAWKTVWKNTKITQHRKWAVKTSSKRIKKPEITPKSTPKPQKYTKSRDIQNNTILKIIYWIVKKTFISPTKRHKIYIFWIIEYLYWKISIQNQYKKQNKIKNRINSTSFIHKSDISHILRHQKSTKAGNRPRPHFCKIRKSVAFCEILYHSLKQKFLSLLRNRAFPPVPRRKQ